MAFFNYNKNQSTIVKTLINYPSQIPSIMIMKSIIIPMKVKNLK